MKELTPRDLFDLTSKISAINDRLLSADQSSVPNCAHGYEDLLNPWRNYFTTTLPQEFESALNSVKNLYSGDCTCSQVIDNMNVLTQRITHIVNAWTLTKCIEAMREAFDMISNPQDAIAFANELDHEKCRNLSHFLK